VRRSCSCHISSPMHVWCSPNFLFSTILQLQAQAAWTSSRMTKACYSNTLSEIVKVPCRTIYACAFSHTVSSVALAHSTGPLHICELAWPCAIIMPYLFDLLRSVFLHTCTAQTGTIPGAGQPSAAAAVGMVWPVTAHCHLSASITAAVPVPPMPASAHGAGAKSARYVSTNLCPNQ